MYMKHLALSRCLINVNTVSSTFTVHPLTVSPTCWLRYADSFLQLTCFNYYPLPIASSECLSIHQAQAKPFSFHRSFCSLNQRTKGQVLRFILWVQPRAGVEPARHCSLASSPTGDPNSLGQALDLCPRKHIAISQPHFWDTYCTGIVVAFSGSQ